MFSDSSGLTHQKLYSEDDCCITLITIFFAQCVYFKNSNFIGIHVFFKKGQLIETQTEKRIWWHECSPAHPGSPRCVLCCSGQASEPDGWRSPSPARSLRPRSTPWRLSPPQRSGHCCLATRARRAGRGLGLAAPPTAWSPAGEERETGECSSFYYRFLGDSALEADLSLRNSTL